MGPKQVGLLYVRQENIAQLWPSIVPVGWNQDAMNTKIASKKFETLGQRDDAGLAAIGIAIDFHRMMGFSNVEARTTELATALKAGLSKINRVKLVTPVDPVQSGGVVISQ